MAYFGNYYRSISPTTISIDPKIATKSAREWFLAIVGKTARLEKLGVLALHLKGLTLFSVALKKNPNSPLGFSALV